MHIQHYAIIFIALVLPFSIVCRALMNNKIDTINNETRINHALDTATFDAIDTIRDINDEFYNIYEGETVNITPNIAMAGIDAFYETLSINFNLPFVGDESYNKEFFSSYIPAVLVLSYDGLYVYSMEQNSAGEYHYTLSPKIPFATEYKSPDGEIWIINFSLGNYIELIAPNGVHYKGEFTRDFIDQSKDKYDGMKKALGVNSEIFLDRLPQLESDMSLTIYALTHAGEDGLGENYSVPTYLNGQSNAISMLTDYDYNHKKDEDVSAFHRERRKVIIETITQVLNEKMNNHNRYADMMGITYDFYLPEIPNEDWINAIDDVAVMAFVQGIPIGPKSYYNSYALGSSRITETEYIYCTNSDNKPYDSNTIFIYGSPGKATHIYHKRKCPYIIEDEDESKSTVYKIFVNKNAAAANGYYPCRVCNP